MQLVVEKDPVLNVSVSPQTAEITEALPEWVFSHVYLRGNAEMSEYCASCFSWSFLIPLCD